MKMFVFLLMSVLLPIKAQQKPLYTAQEYEIYTCIQLIHDKIWKMIQIYGPSNGMHQIEDKQERAVTFETKCCTKSGFFLEFRGNCPQALWTPWGIMPFVFSCISTEKAWIEVNKAITATLNAKLYQPNFYKLYAITIIKALPEPLLASPQEGLFPPTLIELDAMELQFTKEHQQQIFKRDKDFLSPVQRQAKKNKKIEQRQAIDSPSPLISRKKQSPLVSLLVKKCTK
jgi:hypothetical protein